MGPDYLLFWVPPAFIGLTLVVAGRGVASGKLRLFRHAVPDGSRWLAAWLITGIGALPCALLLVRIFAAPKIMLIVVLAAATIEAVLAGTLVISIVREARRGR